MMISPEVYYEMELKGKSKQELRESIRLLKQEIRAMKRELEEESDAQKFMMMPSPLIMIKSFREYLQIAVRAYSEAGGIYRLTKEEKQDLEFNRALLDIRSFGFRCGGFAGGLETRRYTVNGENMRLEMTDSPNPRSSALLVSEPLTKEDFIKGIAELHIGEWKRSYVEPEILDGTQWSVEVEFEGDHEPVRIHGNNAFPYNFRELMEFLNSSGGK